jgi:hypothetical protein
LSLFHQSEPEVYAKFKENNTVWLYFGGLIS